MAGGKDWRHRSAPTLVEFEELAELAWRRLPAEFRAMCGDVLIRIEDFPTEEVLDALKLESPFDLMGLYHGVSLDKKSVSDLPRGPDMVFLYRRPLLDVWAEGTRHWAISSRTCWCTRSATISACPTGHGRASRKPQSTETRREVAASALTGVFGNYGLQTGREPAKVARNGK